MEKIDPWIDLGRGNNWLGGAFRLQKHGSIDQGMDDGGYRYGFADRNCVLDDSGNYGPDNMGKPQDSFWFLAQTFSPKLIEDVTIDGA